MSAYSTDAAVVRLRLWVRRQKQGLCRLTYPDGAALAQVLYQLGELTRDEGLPFHSFDIATAPVEDAANRLVHTLGAWPAGVVAVSGFERVERLDALIDSLNLRREALAEMPHWQVWCMDEAVTRRFIVLAPDITSWMIPKIEAAEAASTPGVARAPFAGAAFAVFRMLPWNDLLHLVGVAAARSGDGKAATRFWERPAFERALKKLVQKFLELFSREIDNAEDLEFAGGAVQRDLDVFLRNEEAVRVLAEPVHGGVRIDGGALARLWTELRLSPLPSEFDWELIAKSYLREVKAVLRAGGELRMALESEGLEEPGSAVEPGFDLTAYAEVLKRDYGTVALSTLQTTAVEIDQRRPVGLRDVFVPQLVRESAPSLDFSKDDIALPERSPAESRAEGPRIEALRAFLDHPTRPVLDVAVDPAHPRLIILGDPGSGKSTLLRYLAVSWAWQPTGTIPLLVELGRYGREDTAGRTILGYIHDGPNATWHLDRRQLEPRLREGRAALLLDGLDEIVEQSQRDAVAAEILRFAEEFPLARIVVTSRPYGYGVLGDRFREAGFSLFSLQEFDDARIKAFLERWHALVWPDWPDRDRYKDRLRAAVKDVPPIRQLAGNPLLLTMMAILNRSQELPRDRADLYEQCTRLLLHDWDVERKLLEFPLVKDRIQRREKQEILRRVAYRMQATAEGLKGNVIAREDLEDEIAGYLTELGVESPVAVARALIQHLRERSFILAFLGGDRFGFVHRTFLDYFCAWAIVKEFSRRLDREWLWTAVFEAHWRDESWHEVLTLLCGMLEPEHAITMIRRLEAEGQATDQFANLILSLRCRAELRIGDAAADLDAAVWDRLTGSVVQGASDVLRLGLTLEAIARMARLWPDKTRSWLANAITHPPSEWFPFVALVNLYGCWPEQARTRIDNPEVI